MSGPHHLAIGIALLLVAADASGQQAPSEYTHAMRYNAAGQLTGTIAPDPDGGVGLLLYAATRNTYGEPNTATSGMLVKVETGQLNSWYSEETAPKDWSGFEVFLTKTFVYDDFGRKIRETVIGTTLGIESVVQYSYDTRDRLKCKAVRMNPVSFADPPTNVCQPGLQGPAGSDRITQYTYNDFDQVLTEQRAVGTPIAQTYVTNEYQVGTKLLRYQTDANGNRTRLDYSAEYRVEKRVYPSKTQPGAVNENDYNRYVYDKNGNVIFEQKRNQQAIQTISYEYDGLNRLVFKDLSDNTFSGDIAYDYDLRGLTKSSCFGGNKFDDDCRTAVANVDGGESNEFDGFGNLVKRVSTMGGVRRELTYNYDREGNRLRITHPDNWFFQYSFDGLNRMNALAQSQSASAGASVASLLTIEYGRKGNRELISRTAGAVTSITLDAAMRLGGFTQNFTSSGDNLTNGFAYNHASQLVTLTQSNTDYNYTHAQNRTGLYARNGLNQYTQIDGEALAYDDNGNLTTDRDADGNLITYSFDLENHLVEVDGPVDASLRYDTLGRLSRLTLPGNIVTQFLYDGDALVAEYRNGVLDKRYVHGDQVDEPLVLYTDGVVSTASRRFLHADHQGSIIAWSNSTGAAARKNAYDPYGIPRPSNSGRFGYTGQTWIPELGLNYYKARFYSPTLGRFLQTDPIFYKDDFNLYGYVGNDPTNKMDPTGLCETQNGAIVDCDIVVRTPDPNSSNPNYPYSEKSWVDLSEAERAPLQSMYNELAAVGQKIQDAGTSDQKGAWAGVNSVSFSPLESPKAENGNGIPAQNLDVGRGSQLIFYEGAINAGQEKQRFVAGHEIFHGVEPLRTEARALPHLPIGATRDAARLLMEQHTDQAAVNFLRANGLIGSRICISAYTGCL